MGYDDAVRVGMARDERDRWAKACKRFADMYMDHRETSWALDEATECGMAPRAYWSLFHLDECYQTRLAAGLDAMRRGSLEDLEASVK